MKNKNIRSTWSVLIACILTVALPAQRYAAPIAVGDVIKLDLGDSGDADGDPLTLTDWNQVTTGANATVAAGTVKRHSDGAIVDQVSILVSGGNDTTNTGQNNDPNSAGWAGLINDPYYNNEALTDLIFGFGPNTLTITFSGLNTNLEYTLRAYTLIDESNRDVIVSVVGGTGTIMRGPESRSTLFQTTPLAEDLIFEQLQPASGGNLSVTISSDTHGVIGNAIVLEVVGQGTPGPDNGIGIEKVDLDANGRVCIDYRTQLGESYEIQTTSDLANEWQPVWTSSGTGTTNSWTDLWPLESSGRKYYRVVEVETPNGNLSSGSLTVTQSWSQETNYEREALVALPSNPSNPAGPHPVLISLHGAGGNPNTTRYNYLEDYIQVAPDGYENQWNTGRQSTQAPDVEFIREIILQLRSYDNVDAGNIAIIGSSNGSALLNQLFIELEGHLFQSGINIISQLVTEQYNNGSFWGDSNLTSNFDEIFIPARGRRFLSICGENDSLAPYTGGNGILGFVFLHAQDSAYIQAQALGESGPQIPLNGGIEDPAGYIRYSYLDGDVVHYMAVGQAHTPGPDNAVAPIVEGWLAP